MATAVPTYKRIPADPADFFEPAEVQKAKDYQRPLTVVRAINLVLSIAVLVVIISTHLLQNLTGGIDNWALKLMTCLLILAVIDLPIDIPIGAWTTFVHEKKWGFSTQTPKGFVSDTVKGFILGFVIQTPLLLALYALMRSTELWWLWGWGVFFVFSVVLAFLFPVVIMPIFNKFTPLEDEELEARLRGLAEGAGMKVSGVQVMDASKRTKKDNAFFAGLGKTRRVVVFDNLLKQSHPVVASVVAHELGHWRRRHVVKSMVLGTITSLALFAVLRFVSTWDAALEWAGVERIGDPASIPIVIATFALVSFAISLIGSWFSRAHERQADLDALEITQDYEAFVECEHGLSTRNLIDLAPTWWRYVRASHPPPAERLRLADLWLQSQSSTKR